MNYRHAFHAGNFADVMKHALLARMVQHLARKERPFRVVDTHAGIGLYDLAGSEAGRTGEWRGGIARMDAPFAGEVETVLAPYRGALASVRARHGPDAYPGSPAILRELLRPNDRAVLVEKHPDDAAILAARYNPVGTMKVLAADGWTALDGLIPPRERRGLVLVDPPYEEPGEMGRAAERVGRAVRRWPTGTFALWYPVKVEDDGDRLADAFAVGLGRDAIRLELLVDRLGTGRGVPGRAPLAGGGLLVVNPPWTLAADAALLLPALAERLASRPGSGSSLIQPLTDVAGAGPAATGAAGP